MTNLEGKVAQQILALVNEGKLSEERIDESVRRLLRDKFYFRLFEDPYVDADKALSITTTEEKATTAEERK